MTTVFIYKTDYSKPVKQEVNGTVILPPLLVPPVAYSSNAGSIAGGRPDPGRCRPIPVPRERLCPQLHLCLLAVERLGETHRLDGSQWHQHPAGVHRCQRYKTLNSSSLNLRPNKLECFVSSLKVSLIVCAWQ
jgi:hypothetical protein